MAPNVDSKVSYAKTTLPYPIFAADFDPYNRAYLIVGGGGGEGRSGVPNQISVLDVADRSAIVTAADISLSRDEDSVQSLGTLATKDGLIVLAGINSAQKEQDAGRNEHLRSFEVKYPPRKKQKTEESGADTKGDYKVLGKRSLFKPSSAAKKETYQRITRLSPASKRETGSKRIGAIATGLSKESQIIVFNATTPTPEKGDVLAHVDLPEGAEVADLDIAEPEESEFSMAYCTDYDIYEQAFRYDFKTKRTEKRPQGPRRVHQLPFPDALETPDSRLKFRCLRFLNPQNVVALCNRSNRRGAELRVYHLYPTGPAIQVGGKILPSHVKQAVSMDVCALESDKDGNQQFAIAVAGQDISIEVFTINYRHTTDTFSSFRSYISLKNVHEHQMTKVCFSPFHPPKPTTATATSTRASTQYVRLASVSYGNTVVVDTFPLSTFDGSDGKTRYVLSHPNDEVWTRWAYILVTSLIVLVIAFIAQSFLGDFGGNRSVSVFGFLPQNVRDFLDQPAAAAYGRKVKWVTEPVSPPPSSSPISGRLRDVIHKHRSSSSDPKSEGHAVIIRPASGDDHPEEGSGVSVDVHPDKEAYLQHDTSAKHWHELEDHEKARWKDRLIRAGEWAEGEGEKVLVGVLFSEYAGLVGEVAGDIIREL